MDECGDFGDALALLDNSAKSRAIVDRTAIMEYRGAGFSHSLLNAG